MAETTPLPFSLPNVPAKWNNWCVRTSQPQPPAQAWLPAGREPAGLWGSPGPGSWGLLLSAQSKVSRAMYLPGAMRHIQQVLTDGQEPHCPGHGRQGTNGETACAVHEGCEAEMEQEGWP